MGAAVRGGKFGGIIVLLVAIVAFFMWASPPSTLEWSGYSHVPFEGCYGEDSQARAQYGGRPWDYLAPGEKFETTIDICTPNTDPALHEGNGGGIALRAFASGKHNAKLVATITSPSGKVYTHGTANVCASETVWHPIEGKPEPSGEGALEAGKWTLSIQNVGRRKTADVMVDFYAHMGYTMAAMCPVGDIVVATS